MNSKKAAVLTVFIIFLGVFGVFAQEPQEPAVPSVTATEKTAPKNENEMQWAWGEVTAIDPQAKTVTLKYLDYETDQEKDLVLNIDEKTAFDNIKALEDIKVKDTLSVDYTAGNDGKNTAKSISYEKKDTFPADTAKPADTLTEQPAVNNETSQPVEQQAVTQPAVDQGVTVQPAEVNQVPAAQTQAPVIQEAAPVSTTTAAEAPAAAATQDMQGTQTTTQTQE